MLNLNKIILGGNLTSTPESRQTKNGKDATKFTIAVNDGFGENKTTNFFNVVAYGNSAKYANNYLAKGQNIYLEGKLNIRSWEDSTGKKNYMTEIIAFTINGLSKPSGTNQAKNESNQKYNDNKLLDLANSIETNEGFTGDDIPF